MANYYKEKNFQFKLANYEIIEEFNIWKAFNNKEDVLNPETNEPYKFPIREGSDLKGTDGVVRKVGDDLKYMKRVDFEKCYPGMAKQTKWIREVLINNELFLYRFSKTVNDEIEKTIAMCKGVGKDPLQLTYDQNFDRGRPPVSMYKLTIVGETTPTAQQVQQTQTAQLTDEQKKSIADTTSQVGKSVNNKSEQALILDETEQAVYNAVKNLPVKLEQTKFVKTFTDNKVADARAKQIYTEKYLKEKK